MRWVLAGLAFALLVSLAVYTAALRTDSLAARRRIAVHNDQIMSLRVEQARRELQRYGRAKSEELIRRIRDLTGGSRAGY